MMPIPPSGRQYPIRSGDQHAVVTEVGASLRSYTHGSWEVVDGYDETEMCPAGHGVPLLPWPNRLEDGNYGFEGHRYQVPITEPARRNALHGLTRWVNWTAQAQDADRVVMGLTLYPQDGYPFTLALAIEYRLAGDGLTVTTSASNLGSGPLPFGTGHHPYFTAGTARVDDAWLRIPAAAYLELDDRQNATGRLLPVDGTAYDFRAERRLAGITLDAAFGEIVPDRDGRTRVHLSGGPGTPRMTLWMEAPYRYLMVYTSDTLRPPRQRRSVAIEPMTCGPNAFRLPQLGLLVLHPGEQIACRWGIAF